MTARELIEKLIKLPSLDVEVAFANCDHVIFDISDLADPNASPTAVLISHGWSDEGCTCEDDVEGWRGPAISCGTCGRSIPLDGSGVYAVELCGPLSDLVAEDADSYIMCATCLVGRRVRLAIDHFDVHFGNVWKGRTGTIEMASAIEGFRVRLDEPREPGSEYNTIEWADIDDFCAACEGPATD